MQLRVQVVAEDELAEDAAVRENHHADDEAGAELRGAAGRVAVAVPVSVAVRWIVISIDVRSVSAIGRMVITIGFTAMAVI